MKASSALVKHIQSEAKRKEASSTAKNLLADPVDSSSDDSPSSEPIWLVLTTKKHIVDQKRLKPGKIPLPHSLNDSPTTTICLITADPQRAFKDTIAHPSFPPNLAPRITRVIGITKLKARYKSFESRRQLLAEHDVFLADSRVIILLPNLLGKVFYKGSKRPIPVNLEPSKPKDPATGKRISQKPKPAADAVRSIVSPPQCAHEIQRALSSAQVHLSPTATTSIRVGLASFPPAHIAENIEAVVNGMVEKFVTKGWRNVRAVHIKGPNTMALPVWLAKELWVDEEDVLEEDEARRRAEKGMQKGKKRSRDREKKKGPKTGEIQDPLTEEVNPKLLKADTKPKVTKRRVMDEDLSAEMQARRKKLRLQKQEVSDEIAEGKKRKLERGAESPKPRKTRKVVDVTAET